MKCPFCKKEIQEGAIKCKHCGSMLSSQGSISTAATPTTAGKVIYIDYSQVPWYRREPGALMFLLALIFTPVTIALCILVFTGDIYRNEYNSKGELKVWGAGNKVAAILILLIQVALIFGIW